MSYASQQLVQMSCDGGPWDGRSEVVVKRGELTDILVGSGRYVLASYSVWLYACARLCPLVPQARYVWAP